MTEIEITYEIDTDPTGCYLVARAEAKDPERTWRLTQHLKGWPTEAKFEFTSKITSDGDWVGSFYAVVDGARWGTEQTFKSFCVPIYHPRLNYGDVYTEYEDKERTRVLYSRMLLKSAAPGHVFYVGLVDPHNRVSPELSVGVMTEAEWIEWTRPLRRTDFLSFAAGRGKAALWDGLERSPVATREKATAEKGYDHPGSVIELPDGGGVIHLQYGHPKEVGTNGCFTVDVIQGLIDNLRVYQAVLHPMRSPETGDAIECLERAIKWINERKRDRETRDVHQTDKP